MVKFAGLEDPKEITRVNFKSFVRIKSNLLFYSLSVLDFFSLIVSYLGKNHEKLRSRRTCPLTQSETVQPRLLLPRHPQHHHLYRLLLHLNLILSLPLPTLRLLLTRSTLRHHHHLQQRRQLQQHVLKELIVETETIKHHMMILKM